MKLIYLDVCVLSRPFDDQSFLRIRLETEAANLILSKVKASEYQMVVSNVHIKEIDAILDIYERIELQERIQSLGEKVVVDLETTKKRAEDLFNIKVWCDNPVIFCEKEDLR